MKKFFILLFILSNLIKATGGYDNGSPVGKGKLQLDFTLNPGDIVEYGQSYITWNYGLTDSLDFHGYGSHEAKGTNQIYYGLKYTLFQSDTLDLSTALGFREREGERHIYAPQLLYTYKLPNEYDIGGSILDVYNITESKNLGVTYDIALRIPFKLSFLQPYIESSKLALGAFRNASGKIYPTYSIDIKF